MRDLDTLVSGLYDRLVLRDLFGKVVPGTIWLTIILAALAPQTNLVDAIGGHGLAVTLLLLGCAWLSAFILQALGEKTHFLRNCPKRETRTTFYQRLAQFGDTADGNARMHAERLLVIKEACGNGGMALITGTLVNALISAAACVFKNQYWTATFTFTWWLLAIMAVGGGSLLVSWHREHVERHKELLERFIAHRAANPRTIGPGAN